MAKPLKIIGILFGGIVILIAAALISIIIFFDPNEYKPQTSQAVEDATGRQLTIDGDIDLSLFPWIGMELGQITLSNATGFEQPHFAHIDGAEVKLKIMPLLKQEVEMKAITLHGLHLNLEIDENGKTNWDDLAQTEEAPSPNQEQPAPEADSGSGAVSLAALAIGGLEITNANVLYDDRATDARYSIEQMNLITGPVSLNAPLDVSLTSQFNSTQPQVSGKLDFKGRIIADIISGEKHRVENMQIGLDFDSPEFASAGQIKISSNVAIDLAAEQYTLQNLSIDTNINNPDLPSGKVIAKLMANIDANLKQETASISGLKLSAYDLNINGQVKATKIMNTPEFNGELAITPFNARQLLTTLEQEIPETADPEVLKNVALNMNFSGTPEAIKINPLKLILDETNLDGWLEADLPADKPMPTVRYALNINGIDADRYLPPVSEEEEVVVPPPSAGAAAAAELPMELLRDLDIDGKLDIGKLKVSGLHVSEIKTVLKAKDGVIKLQPQANLYQGSYKGDIQLDARQDEPHFKLNEALSGIEAGPLLKDLMDDDVASGKGTITAKLTSKGHTPEVMTKTLNGDLSIAFKDGAVKGINTAQIARELKAKLKKQPAPPEGETKGTDFSELTATFKVINGVIHNNDLSTKAPFARINGEGTVDLVNEQLNYLVTAAIVGTAEGAGGAGLDDVKGLKVPVKITGSFTNPKIDPQYDEIIKARLKQEVDRAKQELKAKADAKKAALEQKIATEKEAARLKLEQQKEAARLKAEQEAAQKQEELKQQAEDAIKDKLKGLFN